LGQEETRPRPTQNNPRAAKQRQELTAEMLELGQESQTCGRDATPRALTLRPEVLSVGLTFCQDRATPNPRRKGLADAGIARLPVSKNTRRMEREDRDMIQTVEAIIEPDGKVLLLEPVELKEPRRALVTILEDEPAAKVPETTLLSEPALAEDWNRPEEDEAWSHLQPVR
jgi:hypothetical protein